VGGVNLDDVAEEIRTVLDTITGLRVPPWGVESVQAPAALVSLPGSVDFDETYGRGKDRYPDMAVVVLIGQPEARTARKAAARYAAGAGPVSIKQVLEAHAWVSCEVLTVTSAEFDGRAEYAGVPYLAVVFNLDVIGKGA
jgi:hypothetical protein